MDPAFIEALIGILRRTGVDEIEYEEDGVKLRVRLGASADVTVAPTPVPAPAPGPQPQFEVRATMPSVFYRAPSPGAPPFVAVGDHITAGQTLALLEAMKMMSPIVAEEAGTVLSIHAEDAQPVARGDVLFVIGRGA